MPPNDELHQYYELIRTRAADVMDGGRTEGLIETVASDCFRLADECEALTHATELIERLVEERQALRDALRSIQDLSARGTSERQMVSEVHLIASNALTKTH